MRERQTVIGLEADEYEISDADNAKGWMYIDIPRALVSIGTARDIARRICEVADRGLPAPPVAKTEAADVWDETYLRMPGPDGQLISSTQVLAMQEEIERLKTEMRSREEEHEAEGYAAAEADDWEATR